MLSKPHPQTQERPLRRFSVTVPLGVAEALQRLAERNGLRPSELCREALREWQPLTDEFSRIDGMQS